MQGGSGTVCSIWLLFVFVFFWIRYCIPHHARNGLMSSFNGYICGTGAFYKSFITYTFKNSSLLSLCMNMYVFLMILYHLSSTPKSDLASLRLFWGIHNALNPRIIWFLFGKLFEVLQENMGCSLPFCPSESIAEFGWHALIHFKRVKLRTYI